MTAQPAIRMITTQPIVVEDASQPRLSNGSYPNVTIEPGCYELKPMRNPQLPRDPENRRFWWKHWLVIAGTRKGISPGGWQDRIGPSLRVDGLEAHLNDTYE